MDTHLDRFAQLATEFCEWAESEPGDELVEGRTGLRLLARLYDSALGLRDLEDTEDIEVGEVSHEAWKVVYARFGALPFQHYRSVFDPRKALELDSGPEVGDLADDLADVYRDLRDGLELLRCGHAAEAEWHWCFRFRNHWGRHAASALHALHCWAADTAEW